MGIVGLREAFEQLYSLGVQPHDRIRDQLLTITKASNYVPRSAEHAYKAALLCAYTAFWTDRYQAQS